MNEWMNAWIKIHHQFVLAWIEWWFGWDLGPMLRSTLCVQIRRIAVSSIVAHSINQSKRSKVHKLRSVVWMKKVSQLEIEIEGYLRVPQWLEHTPRHGRGNRLQCLLNQLTEIQYVTRFTLMIECLVISFLIHVLLNFDYMFCWSNFNFFQSA